MLGQLWPFIGQYVQEMLVEVVEPSLRASLPSYLQSFKFETIDLGDIVSTNNHTKDIHRKTALEIIELFTLTRNISRKQQTFPLHPSTQYPDFN